MIKFILLGFIFIFGSSVKANDSQIGSREGQIKFLKNSAISLLSEKLDVSEEKIIVDYVFQNRSKTIQELDVGFPLPAVSAIACEIVEGECEPEPKMKVWVRGKEDTNVKWNRYLMFRNKLLKMRYEELPDSVKEPGFESAYKSESHLQFCSKFLSETGVKDCHLFLELKVMRVFEWKLKAEPSEKFTVRHEFEPSLGFGNPRYFLKNGDTCIDELKGSVALPKEMKQPYPRWVRYILTTGSNWEGNIQDFSLIVRKKKSSDIVSTCFKGLKKIDEYTLEAKRKNFSPSRDLTIVWFETESSIKAALGNSISGREKK